MSVRLLAIISTIADPTTAPSVRLAAASLTDGAVVGSAIVDIIANNLTDTPQEGIKDDIVQKVATFVGELARAIRK